MTSLHFLRPQTPGANRPVRLASAAVAASRGRALAASRRDFASALAARLRRAVASAFGRNRCANCAHWLSADRQRGECQLWKSIALPVNSVVALPPEAHPPLRPGAKVPATSSCSGFTLPTVALGRAHPSGQPGEPVATPQEERAA